MGGKVLDHFQVPVPSSLHPAARAVLQLYSYIVLCTGWEDRPLKKTWHKEADKEPQRLELKRLNAFLHENLSNSDRFVIQSDNLLYHINNAISHAEPEICLVSFEDSNTITEGQTLHVYKRCHVIKEMLMFSNACQSRNIAVSQHSIEKFKRFLRIVCFLIKVAEHLHYFSNSLRNQNKRCFWFFFF